VVKPRSEKAAAEDIFDGLDAMIPGVI